MDKLVLTTCVCGVLHLGSNCLVFSIDRCEACEKHLYLLCTLCLIMILLWSDFCLFTIDVSVWKRLELLTIHYTLYLIEIENGNFLSSVVVFPLYVFLII